MPKPTLTAADYAANSEIIKEFRSGVHRDSSGARIGGLIEIRDHDGVTSVSVHRIDPGVIVRAGDPDHPYGRVLLMVTALLAEYIATHPEATSADLTEALTTGILDRKQGKADDDPR